MFKKLIPVLCTVLFLMGCSEDQKENEQNLEAKTERVEQQETGEEEAIRRQNLVRDALERIREKEEEKRPETIVLDPGHSGVVAGGSEPLGPGSTEVKAADSGGTSGVASGVPEYELTFQMAVQLKAELEERGYTVILTRESNEVPVSCVERAEIANQAQADAYVRIHANGSENPSAVGAMTICTTAGNPYAASLYEQSRRLSDCILNRFCEATGCVSEGVWETDTMSGNNWSRVPVTILEMGYMTNPEEDLLMQTPDYQRKMLQGIANGIDEFLGY